MPLIILAICLVTYLALIPILRSVVLPAIAVALNMLTVAAAFGVLTLLFVGDDPPMGGAGKLDVVTVTGIFVITFALSIDYQVFLLTRMREEYVRTQSHEAALEFGIAKTARVVTGAAAIMIAVFTAFALSSFSLIQQLGIGLAVAVLIDATIVRLGLLPAIMKLCGDRTWWIPTLARRDACRCSTPRARSSSATPATCAAPPGSEAARVAVRSRARARTGARSTRGSRRSGSAPTRRRCRDTSRRSRRARRRT